MLGIYKLLHILSDNLKIIDYVSVLGLGLGLGLALLLSLLALSFFPFISL